MATASSVLERGLAFGAYVLVQPERASEEEQVWLARTAALPPSPITARFRGRTDASGASPFGQEAQLGKFLQHASIECATEEIAVGPWICAVSPGAPGVPLPVLAPALATLRAQNEAQWSAAIAHVVIALLTGLDVAHRATGAPGQAKGIVHGGVRPSALTIAADGAVKLGGFGVLRDDDPSRVAERGLEGMAYAAPEQFGTRGRAPTMDLWSAGAVLHELLDGRTFRGELTDVRALYRVALAGEVPTLSRPAPELLERMRAWLLAVLPRDRPRSAADAIAAMGPQPAGAANVLVELVRAHRAGGVAPSMQHSMPPPAAPAYSQPPAPAYPPPPAYSQPPPSAYPQPPAYPQAPAYPPAPAHPQAFTPPPALVEEEGTVELDQAVLAAMRAGTRPPQPASAPPPAQPQSSGDLMMPPPAARSSRAPAPQPVQPPMVARAPAPAQPRPPMPVASPQPRAPMPVAPPPERPRAPPVVVESRAPQGPLDLQPAYEPTTTTMLQARKSTRNFVIILVVAAVLAIGIGGTVGYLIVGDDPVAPATKAKP